MLSFVSFLVLAPAPPQIFDQSIAAFKKRTSFSVTVGLDANLNGKVTAERYRMSYLAPQKVLLTKLKNNQPNLIFWMNGSNFIAYDPSAREMVKRQAPTKGPIVNRLANVMGGVEDPVAAQLSFDTMEAFISPFKQLQGWSASTQGGIIRLVRPSMVEGKKTLTEFQFNAGSKLLTKALLLGPSSKLQWTFTYHPTPKTLSFSPPRGTKVVEALASHTRINAADATANNLVNRCVRAYSRLDSVAFSVNGTTGNSTSWMSGSSFKEKQPLLEWSYHKGVLTIRDIARKKSYRGKCKPSGVTTYLRLLNRPMDTILQGLLMKKNPVNHWFTTGAKISSKGSLSLGPNGMVDVLELNSRTVQVSITIRRDSSLIATVSSRTKDAAGQVVSRSNRDFKYWTVNKPIPSSTFAVQVTNPLPLSRIGKR